MRDGGPEDAGEVTTPTAACVIHVWPEVMNTFRYDADGRLAEEWVQTDYRSFLTKLGVTTTESAQQGTHAGSQ
jgi:hypothetical protein